MASPIWIVIVAVLGSSLLTSVVVWLLNFRKVGREEYRADKGLEISVANVFREDNLALRAEIRLMQADMQRQAETIGALTAQNAEMAKQVANLTGEVARLTAESALRLPQKESTP